MSGENFDIKVFISTAWTGTRNAARTFSLKSNSFSGLFGKNTFAMRSFLFMALG